MAERQATIEERISAALAPEDIPAAAEATEAPAEAAPTETAETETAPTETPTEAAEAEVIEAAEDIEEIGISKLVELGEHNGLDAADVYSLTIPITDADGNKQEITIGEYKDRVQDQSKAQRAEKAAREAKEKYEAQARALSEKIEAEAQEKAVFLQAAEKQLMKDFDSVDWESLRVSNPTEWAARRQELQERQGALYQMRQQAAQAYDAGKQQQTQQQLEQRQALLERESEALLSALPTWKKDDVRVAEQAELRTYLLDSGFDANDIDNAIDHRNIVLAHKAMMYDKKMSAGETAKKKVVKLGSKVLKPGAKQSKGEQRQDAEKSLRQRLKATGKTDDFAALLSHRLGK